MSDNAQGSAAPIQAAPESSESIESTQNDMLTGQEGQETSEAPAQAASAEVKKRLKSLKLKIDGEEFDEELPFEIDDNPETVEYMRKQLQLAKVAQKRMGSYSQLEKEVKQFVEALRKNPRKALSDPSIGIDVKKLAQEVIEEEIANSQKSPDQIEREKLEMRLKELEEEKKTQQEEFKKKELERLQEIEYQRYDQLMTEALEKSDLPKSPYVVKKIADYMLLGLENNIDVAPADVLPLVRDEVLNDIKEMFNVMPEEVIEKLIGRDKINSLRKKSLAKAKEKPTVALNKSVLDSGATKGQKVQKDDKKQTFKDFFGT